MMNSALRYPKSCILIIPTVAIQNLLATYLNYRFCYYFIDTPLRGSFSKNFIKSVRLATPVVFPQLQSLQLHEKIHLYISSVNPYIPMDATGRSLIKHI